jgi:hypothetical protein
MIKLTIRTGMLPAFEVVRVLPAGQDGEHSYQVQCSAEPYARVVKEHELAPAT